MSFIGELSFHVSVCGTGFSAVCSRTDGLAVGRLEYTSSISVTNYTLYPSPESSTHSSRSARECLGNHLRTLDRHVSPKPFAVHQYWARFQHGASRPPQVRSVIRSKAHRSCAVLSIEPEELQNGTGLAICHSCPWYSLGARGDSHGKQRRDLWIGYDINHCHRGRDGANLRR